MNVEKCIAEIEEAICLRLCEVRDGSAPNKRTLNAVAAIIRRHAAEEQSLLTELEAFSDRLVGTDPWYQLNAIIARQRGEKSTWAQGYNAAIEDVKQLAAQIGPTMVPVDDGAAVVFGNGRLLEAICSLTKP